MLYIHLYLQDIIFKEIVHKGNQRVAYNLPERTNKPNRPFDACRIHGALTLNKVAGNFHITGGKSIHFGRGHIHITSLFADSPLNFTHRINRLSFGEHTAGVVHPLEGDERIITDSNYCSFQYIFQIVQNDIHVNFNDFRYHNGSVFH